MKFPGTQEEGTQQADIDRREKGQSGRQSSVLRLALGDLAKGLLPMLLRMLTQLLWTSCLLSANESYSSNMYPAFCSST